MSSHKSRSQKEGECGLRCDQPLPMRRSLLQCPSSSCRTAQENGSSSGEDEFSCSIPGCVHAHLICRTHTASSLFPVPPQGKSTKPARPSPLSKVYTAPQQPTSPPPPPKEAPRSPEKKVKPPIDADSQPPSSPGSSEVKVTKSLVRQLAQVVARRRGRRGSPPPPTKPALSCMTGSWPYKSV